MIDEKDTEEPTKKVPVKVQYEIETKNGVYVLKRPMGRAGILHFNLVTKAVPTTYDEDGRLIPSPGDNERFTQCFMEWYDKVLPGIYVSGPFSVAEMPGEDSYALFLAMFNVLNLGGGDLFRIRD